jgi:phage protein D
MTSELRYAPEVQLLIDGVPAPALLRASLLSLTLHSDLEGVDRLDLTLANQGLRWLDHPALGLDRELRLRLGYAPGPLEQLFVGAVVSHEATFPSGSAPTLTVSAQDRRHRMQRGVKARWFAVPAASLGNWPLPDQAVAGIIGLEHGLIPIFEPVGAALAVLLGGVETAVAIGDPDARQRAIRKQAGQSDFDFLARIAAENGWELLVDHSGPLGGYQLRFFSPLDHLAPDLTLTYGRSLIEFTPRITTVGQIASVTAYIWVAQIKTQFTITVGWDWDRQSLTLSVVPSAMPADQGESCYHIEDPVTALTAPRRILSELLPRLNRRLTGSGSVIGEPRLRPGAVLQLEGLGRQFGGLYRVTAATHTLDGGGYRTSFEARKEIWFGSIPLPEQGAVPVRLES